MKLSAVVAAFLFAAVPDSTSRLQDPQPAAPTDQHQWLQQLIGEWSVTSEASMGPGTEPMKMAGTDTTRAFGKLWVQSELNGEMMGDKMTAQMTLGYDPAKNAFVGSWIDTMQTHLWVYEGQLDDKRKVLTLSARGPSFDDPSKLSDYHDTITIIDKDTRTLTSSVQGADGKWTQFMKAEYRRKK